MRNRYSLFWITSVNAARAIPVHVVTLATYSIAIALSWDLMLSPFFEWQWPLAFPYAAPRIRIHIRVHVETSLFLQLHCTIECYCRYLWRPAVRPRCVTIIWSGPTMKTTTTATPIRSLAARPSWIQWCEFVCCCPYYPYGWTWQRFTVRVESCFV